MVHTGSSINFAYGWEESSFGGGSAARNKKFGLDNRLTGFTVGNNPIPLPELFSVVYSSYAFGLNTYRYSFDAQFSNPWIFQAIFNTAAVITNNGDGSYTHKWTVDKTVKSFETEVGTDNGASDYVRKLQGCVLNSLNLSSSVGAGARLKGEVGAAKMTNPLTTSLGSMGTDSENFPFTFVHGTLAVPNAAGTKATVNKLQTVDLTFDQQAELLPAHGSYEAVDAYRKASVFTGRFNAAEVDQVRIEDVLGRAEFAGSFGSPFFTLTYTNGLTGANKKELVINGVGLVYPEHSASFEPNEPVFEDVPFQLRDVQIALTNSASSVS